MTYSVYPSVQTLVDATKGNAPESKNVMVTGRYFKYEWDCMTKGNQFNGKTSIVIKNIKEPHPYEASLVSSIEAEIISDDFFKKKFAFCNRQTVGQRVDIPRYLNGDQRCWFATKRQKRIQKAVRVFAPMGGIGSVSEEEMAVCGALSCAVCEMLESNGISVEMWASCCATSVFNRAIGCGENDPTTEDDWTDICQLVKVKDSNEYVDYGFVNFVTGNHHFYRNLIFKDRIIAGVDAYNSGQGKMFSSMGSSYNMRKELIPEDEDHDRNMDIVVPRIYKVRDAQRYIMERFCGSGGEIGNVIRSSECRKEEE